jgi:tetratricopeptide (TPR) repeat protein
MRRYVSPALAIAWSAAFWLAAPPPGFCEGPDPQPPHAAEPATPDPVPPEVKLNELTAQYSILLSTRQAERAAAVAAEAVREAEAAFGPEDLRVAQPLNDLGYIEYLLGRYAQAIERHQRALRIRERQGDDAAVVQSLSNLARAHQSQGAYQDAEPLLKRMIALLETRMGAEHFRVAMALKRLAEGYVAQGRFADAEPVLARALRLGSKELGDTHPDLAGLLEPYEQVLSQLGRTDEARQMAARLQAIRAAQPQPLTR